VDRVIIVTTLEKEDDVIEDFCRRNDFLCHRGSMDKVLERYYRAASRFGADIIVRVTGDCPLIDPKIIDFCIDRLKKSKYDYISNVFPGDRTFPRGLDVEVFSFSALEKAYKEAKEIYELEHVTPYIWENRNQNFIIGATVVASPQHKRNYRMTVDYLEDLDLIKTIYSALYKPGHIVDSKDAIRFLDENPRVASINSDCAQKAIK